MFSPPHKIDIGVITEWSGGLGNIPPGWFLCDGTHETPDLRSKFIVATGPLFAVGDEGGLAGHGHHATADTHFHFIGTGVGVTQAAGHVNFLPAQIDTLDTSSVKNLPPTYNLALIQYQGVS